MSVNYCNCGTCKNTNPKDDVIQDRMGRYFHNDKNRKPQIIRRLYNETGEPNILQTQFEHDGALVLTLKKN